MGIYLEGSGVGSGGGHDDAVAHRILLGEQAHQLGDRGPLLADADVPAPNNTTKSYNRSNAVELDRSELDRYTEKDAEGGRDRGEEGGGRRMLHKDGK